MKKLLFTSILWLIFCFQSFSQPVSLPEAETAVHARLNVSGMDGQRNILGHVVYRDSAGLTLFFLFELSPKGYMIVPGNMELPLVLAYSYTDSPDPEGRLLSLAVSDLTLRLKHQPETVKNNNRLAWEKVGEIQNRLSPFQQWPEPGTTLTGGWLETNWTQNSPYNLLCPMDLVTGVRSIAGCPAVAMAQILNFHQTINGVKFRDTDDYHHNYAGRNYMIDDDYLTVGFPSFPMLNDDLESLQGRYSNGIPPTNTDKAALTFACGVAAKQVFTSSSSGTFGVSQAFDAYLKFNFEEVSLLVDGDLLLYPRMAQNVKDTLPVHLAIVDPAWSMGHNVVVDGYNTDKYYHLNFGWGGSYNGWYLLPDEIPYGLTVIEGAIVDINPDVSTGMAGRHGQPALFYPNPANEVLYISGGNRGYTKAELYSADGRLHWCTALDGTNTVVNLSDFRAGIYLIRISGRDGVVSGKILICR
ncbi:MAG: C10 family peptidase [Bacteroidetes bacterium]|nr:C10 family peptidase [Bacteroidota bacterium]